MTKDSIAASVISILPAAVGAVIAMRWQPKSMPVGGILLAFASSVAIGFYGGRGLTAYLEVKSDAIGDLIMLATALFGLAAVSAAMGEIGPLVKRLANRAAQSKDNG